MKTSDLTGPALDWAVAKCLGVPVDLFRHRHPAGYENYSTNWAQGGPIIEREMFSIKRGMDGEWRCEWAVQRFGEETIENTEFGPTPLIAARRCFVASKLGDEVEIPEEIAK